MYIYYPTLVLSTVTCLKCDNIATLYISHTHTYSYTHTHTHTHTHTQLLSVAEDCVASVWSLPRKEDPKVP